MEEISLLEGLQVEDVKRLVRGRKNLEQAVKDATKEMLENDDKRYMCPWCSDSLAPSTERKLKSVDPS